MISCQLSKKPVYADHDYTTFTPPAFLWNELPKVLAHHTNLLPLHLFYCIFTGSYSTCGEANLKVTTEEPLTLTSPNYPNPYPDQHDCTWFIEGPENLNLVVKFKDLGIEDCCDTMTIGYGSDSMDRSSIVGQYYGETLASGFEVILNQQMWVRLQSDFGTGMEGFYLEVYAIDCK